MRVAMRFKKTGNIVKNMKKKKQGRLGAIGAWVCKELGVSSPVQGARRRRGFRRGSGRGWPGGGGEPLVFRRLEVVRRAADPGRVAEDGSKPADDGGILGRVEALEVAVQELRDLGRVAGEQAGGMCRRNNEGGAA